MSFYGQVVKDFNNYPPSYPKSPSYSPRAIMSACSSAMALPSPQLGTIPTSVQ